MAQGKTRAIGNGGIRQRRRRERAGSVNTPGFGVEYFVAQRVRPRSNARCGGLRVKVEALRKRADRGNIRGGRLRDVTHPRAAEIKRFTPNRTLSQTRASKRRGRGEAKRPIAPCHE
jgi:hypothetical protein